MSTNWTKAEPIDDTNTLETTITVHNTTHHRLTTPELTRLLTEAGYTPQDPGGDHD